MTSGSLWNYYRDEVNDYANENAATGDYRIIIHEHAIDYNTLDTEFAPPLKYLSNFWRSLNIPLVSCEIELDLALSRNYIISEISKTAEVTGNPNANLLVPAKTARSRTSTLFQINSAKLCFPVATLPLNDNIKFLENLKQGFKRTFFWNRYRTEITTHPKTAI